MTINGLTLPSELLLDESAPLAGEWVIDLHTWLGATMEKPLPYGPYHLACLFGVIALSVLLSYLFRNAGRKAMRAILISFWVVMVAFELTEQIWCSSDLINGELVWNYRWTLFPFQLCATGFWILPLIFISDEGRFKDALMMFMGLYSLFAGAFVVLIPMTVFTNGVLTNIHTVVQHGSQVIIGVMILVNYRKKLNFRRFLSAIPVFLACLGIAVGLNELLYHVGMAYGNQYYEVNMFYISHRFNNNMPFFGELYEVVPWVVYVLGYAVTLTLAAFVVYFIAILSIHIAESIRERKLNKQTSLPGDDTIKVET